MAYDEPMDFNQWIDYVFNHPVTDPQYHFGIDADYWDGAAPIIINYLTRTFDEAATLLLPFSDASEASAIVDEFLANNPGISTRLKKYALAAREGAVQ